MNINKPQHARLLFIDKKIREGSYPNTTTLSRDYEISPRTIGRDIEYMRDMLGAPVGYDTRRKGYYYTEQNFFLPAIDIKESDLFAICVTEKALRQYENTPLYSRLSAIFDKLKENLPDSVRVNTSWIDTQYTFMHESFTFIKPEIWETVSNSLRQHRQLEIVHRKAGASEPVTRVVEPYHIVNFRGEWYLVGHCRRRGAVLRFALSRIQSAVLLNTSYAIPADFNFNSFIGSSFGIMTEETEYTVKISFSAELAPYITERQWHHSQRIEQREDGSVVISFGTNSLFEVKRWVLSWGAGATVLEPLRLCDMVLKDIESLFNSYRG